MDTSGVAAESCTAVPVIVRSISGNGGAVGTGCGALPASPLRPLPLVYGGVDAAAGCATLRRRMPGKLLPPARPRGSTPLGLDVAAAPEIGLDAAADSLAGLDVAGLDVEAGAPAGLDVDTGPPPELAVAVAGLDAAALAPAGDSPGGDDVANGEASVSPSLRGDGACTKASPPAIECAGTMRCPRPPRPRPSVARLKAAAPPMVADTAAAAGRTGPV